MIPSTWFSCSYDQKKKVHQAMKLLLTKKLPSSHNIIQVQYLTNKRRLKEQLCLKIQVSFLPSGCTVKYYRIKILKKTVPFSSLTLAIQNKWVRYHCAEPNLNQRPKIFGKVSLWKKKLLWYANIVMNYTKDLYHSGH